MLNNKRSELRRSVNLPACVVSSTEPRLRRCVVVDMSEHGAKLELENAEDLPEHFTVLLSRRAALKRNCVLMWRSPTCVGVRFENASRTQAPARLA